MGAWGPKVFDTDSACDYAADVAAQLIRTVEDNLVEEKLRTSDADDVVMSSVAMLCVLANEISTMRCSISRNRAAGWQTAYMKWFDSYYPTAVTPSHLEETRAERLQWFARLAEIADGDDDIDEAMDAQRRA